MNSKPFPWRCAECGEKAIRPAVVDHSVQVKHENIVHDVRVDRLPVNKCENCGCILGTDEGEAVIDIAVRDHLHLLSPQVIKTCRQELGMKQRDLAAACGFAESAWSKWENGAMMQSRATDRIIRAYFAVPELRWFFSALESDSTLGKFVVWHKSDDNEFTVQYVTSSPSSSTGNSIPHDDDDPRYALAA